jgi:hypothetical protein
LGAESREFDRSALPLVKDANLTEIIVYESEQYKYISPLSLGFGTCALSCATGMVNTIISKAKPVPNLDALEFVYASCREGASWQKGGG